MVIACKWLLHVKGRQYQQNNYVNFDLSPQPERYPVIPETNDFSSGPGKSVTKVNGWHREMVIPDKWLSHVRGFHMWVVDC